MTFSSDHDELRRYVRQWLDERAPLEAVRRVMETEEGYDPQHWRELGELGWLGTAMLEEHGGAGLGFLELAVLGEEMGRSLFPSPILSTVIMGAWLLTAMGDDDSAPLLAAIGQGQQTVAVAFSEPDRPWATEGYSTTAERDDGRWVLAGSKHYVVSGHSADKIIVAAQTASGPGLFLVDGNERGVSRRRMDEMDLTRPLGVIDLVGAEGRVLGDPGPAASEALEAMLVRAVAFVAMEQVGGAQACLEMAVEYSKSRHQFGRPIGSFQAIKHMCAEMLIEVESAKSAAYHLASVIDGGGAEAQLAAPIAKSFCSDAFYRCAADTIQIHGGIGFTWEHDAHLYFKRAKSSGLIFGDACAHRERLADVLGV